MPIDTHPTDCEYFGGHHAYEGVHYDKMDPPNTQEVAKLSKKLRDIAAQSVGGTHADRIVAADLLRSALLDLAATKKNSGVVTIDNLLGEDTSRTIIMMKTVNEDSVMKALTQLVEELNIPKPSMFYTPTNHSAVHFESSGVGFCTECLKKKVAIMEIPCGKEYGGKAYMCEECYSKRDDAGPVFKIEY
ncbi:hypothetical protein Pmar_PMAR015937 [Perkinsus marinus ATCC 50983]|uniref:Uncharacterized protein n=1 Tax=Perkinsus marinus (strain ATCC 50983 / TXsc) TaxID=423536 RepID=C5L452_PERM5|nr:hypothetical protein Pmar_PMAR015937 [Perkinsus marinus ATCC 50983]EER08518.1 hypothetical protein Pmar_PMAR015937 [Perkinsus marinus ATCC 50983]|eukprot:XP_002776702.1 hypothetical protein Pmar_PMAR015937 [Perkinsus marinus ATCC 50983]